MRVRRDDFFRRLGATGSSASASRTWPATGTPTTSPPCSRRSRRGSPSWCPRGCSGCATSTCGTSRGRSQHAAGARRNIQRHYDLSNDLFALFLDETMTYSSAWFCRRHARDAQRRKIDRLLDAAGVGLGTHVLEIGTGWGALAVARRAARREGDHAHPLGGAGRARPRAAPARRRVGTASTCSCATTASRGRYDAVVSVEMIEAVGERYWPTYFATLDRALAPGGRVGLQAICWRTTGCSRRATSTRGSPSTSSRAARCRRCGRSRSASASTPTCGSPSVPLRRRLRADAARLAGALRRARRGGRRHRLRRARSAACGTSTSRTARPASPPATSTSPSSSLEEART